MEVFIDSLITEPECVSAIKMSDDENEAFICIYQETWEHGRRVGSDAIRISESMIKPMIYALQGFAEILRNRTEEPAAK